MMKKRSLLCISLLLCLALVSCKGKSEEEARRPGKRSPEKGMASVDVPLHTLDGKEVTLYQFRGKVVLLNFWATWCPPCREEMPSMDALYQKFQGRDLVILAASIDEDPKTVSEFMKKNNYTLPVYHDPNKKAGSVYGITGVPETFIIGKSGVIEEKVIGPLDWMKPDVIQFLESLL